MSPGSTSQASAWPRPRRWPAEKGVAGTWITADATTWQPSTPTTSSSLDLQMPADERAIAVRTAVRRWRPAARSCLCATTC